VCGTRSMRDFAFVGFAGLFAPPDSDTSLTMSFYAKFGGACDDIADPRDRHV
jgi:hypothetical protein